MSPLLAALDAAAARITTAPWRDRCIHCHHRVWAPHYRFAYDPARGLVLLHNRCTRRRLAGRPALRLLAALAALVLALAIAATPLIPFGP